MSRAAMIDGECNAVLVGGVLASNSSTSCFLQRFGTKFLGLLRDLFFQRRRNDRQLSGHVSRMTEFNMVPQPAGLAVRFEAAWTGTGELALRLGALELSVSAE
jgi:hypothetical protein